jgi:hypothetical protein
VSAVRDAEPRIQHSEIDEASGIVASREQPGVLWVHNDSGDRPRVFATNQRGDDLGTFALDAASAMDWEGIAIGPGPVVGRTYLYIGDIGDNARARDTIRIYRVQEPHVGAAGSASRLAEIEEIEVRYPDGPHDAETLMLDPITGALLVVVKTHDVGAGVYRVSAIETPAPMLEHIADITLGDAGSVATGGDVSADGRQIAVRTYSRVFVWRRVDDEPIAAALAREPCVSMLRDDGEAFAWLPGGEGWVTVTEGRAAAIWGAERR